MISQPEPSHPQSERLTSLDSHFTISADPENLIQRLDSEAMFICYERRNYYLNVLPCWYAIYFKGHFECGEN